MLIKIEKKGHRWIITNNPPIKYRKFALQIDESDIISGDNENKEQQQDIPGLQEIIDIRNKYPQLQAIDQLTSNWMVNESDNQLLQDYFKQRAEDEGII
jgi:hypothetical protein